MSPPPSAQIWPRLLLVIVPLYPGLGHLMFTALNMMQGTLVFILPFVVMLMGFATCLYVTFR